MARNIKFVNSNETDFFNVLRQRVDHYFASNGLSTHANARMVIKTIVMLGLYFIPYALLMTSMATGWAFWSCWFIMGTGLAGIGMSVMHDANHKAYSSNNTINSIIGHTLNLVGGDAYNWKLQHNILHHTYTNIHPLDEDIINKPGLRFSPGAAHQPLHRFQFIYAFFLYTLLSLFWVIMKDITQFFRYIRKGLIKEKGFARWKHFATLITWKLFYIGYMLVLPIVVIDVPIWHILLGFLMLHVVGGSILSLVFQLAHVVETTTYPTVNKEGNIENEWAIHQLRTTADFATGNPFLTFYVGGLNFQAIHHLFPRICHVHYPKLAPIVEATAREFNVPYICYPTFGAALRSHVRMLKKLGRKEYIHLLDDLG